MNRPPDRPRHIGAGDGWRWFCSAVSMVRRWPGTFLGMGLIVAVIDTLIPYLGALVVLIMGPAFLAGIGVAAHHAAAGRRPSWRHLFAMFEDAPQRREALKLCVPLIAGKVAAALVLGIALANLVTRRGIAVASLQGHPDKLLALLFDQAMYPWLGLAFAIVLFAWTFTALAIPRVALSSQAAFDAMGESFRLVWRHLAAWIVAGVALMAGLVVLVLLLQLTRVPLIAQLGVLTALYAVLGPMLYAAWRDLYGSASAPDDDQPAPPPRPPAPPPPSGVLEA